MDGCEALLPTRQLFTHGLLSRLASLQLLLLGHRTLRTQACQPMSARPSEAKRGRVQMSAAQVTSSSSSSSSFLPLAFLFTTAFWALLEPPPAPVGCETSAESRPSVSGGRKHGIGRQRLPSPVESTRRKVHHVLTIKTEGPFFRRFSPRTSVTPQGHGDFSSPAQARDAQAALG